MGGLEMAKITGIFTTVSLIDPHVRYTRDINLLSTYFDIIEHANLDRILFDFENESLIFEKYFSRLFLLGSNLGFFFGIELLKAYSAER